MSSCQAVPDLLGSSRMKTELVCPYDRERSEEDRNQPGDVAEPHPDGSGGLIIGCGLPTAGRTLAAPDLDSYLIRGSDRVFSEDL